MAVSRRRAELGRQAAQVIRFGEVCGATFSQANLKSIFIYFFHFATSVPSLNLTRSGRYPLVQRLPYGCPMAVFTSF